MKVLICLLLLLASQPLRKNQEVFPELNYPSKPAVNPDYNQWLKSTPKGAVKKQASTSYRNRRNLKISYKLFSDKTEHHLDIDNCDTLTIEYCAFKNATGRSVDLYNCKVVLIRYCYFENDVSGFYANRCTGVRVYGNQFKNMLGPPTDGHAIQFNTVYGRRNLIRANCIVNYFGKSNPEDNIALYKSTGEKDSPIDIDSNYLWGGGPSTSGGGILLGDDGGQYQRARHNICINPGQYGICNSGASDAEITDNIVFQQQEEWTNVGICTYDNKHIGCSNNSVRNNRVYYVNKKGKRNPHWFPSDKDSCAFTIVVDNKWNDESLNDVWEPPTSVKAIFTKKKK